MICCKLTGRLTETSSLRGSLSSASTLTGSLTVPSVVGSQPYTGVYEVTPAVYSQTLETAGKRLAEDVTVLEIPFYETSNLSGGYTAIIGG